ncbi:PHD finger protein 1 isoform X5 [Tupaia chinensis]|uniref:PHD finger protein 1 isoform X5 n=1 Tax=Tupaia chinensis TaxID=246437 RepID=UPI0007041C02|nr:PHD finger protein 1 isoform X5 [Tupaia chinensis]
MVPKPSFPDWHLLQGEDRARYDAVVQRALSEKYTRWGIFKKFMKKAYYEKTRLGFQIFSHQKELWERPDESRTFSASQLMASVMKLLHGFLEVAVEAGHAAGEEGVHHALGEVTAEVGLEECDQRRNVCSGGCSGIRQPLQAFRQGEDPFHPRNAIPPSKCTGRTHSGQSPGRKTQTPPPPTAAAALAAASYAPEPRDGGAGPGDPLASACPPPDARTCSPRAGGSPRSPTSAPTRLPAAPAVTGPPQDAMAQPPRLSRSGAPALWDPASPGPTSGPRPRLWEGQDVLARWTDGLLYLGTIKKVDSAREVCLVQFEDDSQFLVLWKDISPAALPGEELLCCVCRSETVVPGNRLVSCEKCRHAYHQDCHVPRAPAPGEGEGASWVCRQCVFAIATKRGGALKKGPYARAMLGMKLSLPYGLKGLDWDAGHLSNRQQSYCYCGGPGEWNLKMLQCRSCLQWFHEACTQCLSKPLLYGDRFYEFECCVCRGGPEKVRRLQLRWVDVAHLVLYHLSVCCKKKYFDFDREILPFTSENWDSLLLGELSDTPKGERSSKLLSALNSHKDRFISGREIKKRKCLFGLHARTPPPVESPTGDGAPTRAGPWGRGLTSPGEAPEAGARAPEEEAEGEGRGAGATLSSAQSARAPGAEGAGTSAQGTAAAPSGCSLPSTLLPALQGPLGMANPQTGHPWNFTLVSPRTSLKVHPTQ